MELERSVTQLNTENYPRWKFEIEAILEAKDCLDVVNGETPCPSAGDGKIGAWRKRDALARSIISRSLDDFHHAFIRSCRTSREMMDSIICIKEQATVSNKLLVSSEFHAYRWKAGMNVASFVAGLNAIVNKMESLKTVMDDASIVGKAVQCLPPQFANFRESWRLSAPRFAKLTDLTSQLLACESDQVSRSMQTQISTGEALVGRKVGSPSKNVNNKSKYKDVVCWNCKKKGHTRSDCRSNKWVSSRPRDSEGKQTSREGFVVRNVDIHQERNDGWIADSGAFKHITRNRHWFPTFKDTEPCGVRVGNDKLLYAVRVGTIEVEVYDGMSWTPSTSNNVLYVPEFGTSCLFSLGAAAARGYTVTIRAEIVCLEKDGKAELIGYKDGDLYTLLIRRPSSDFWTPAMFMGPERLSLELWHQRLGHISIEKIKGMHRQELVSGLKIIGEQEFFCEGCIFGSMSRKPHWEVTERRESLPGQVLHTDVCGPFVQPSVGGSFYFICFKDESSGYRKVYFLKRKDEVLRCLETVTIEVKQETGRAVERIRSDCGSEFVTKAVSDFLNKNRIVHEKSPPYTPQCNGMAERENRTLVEKTRSMLCSRNLPKSLWAEAINTAAYVMNRVPNCKDVRTTPYEQWFGRRP
ncbi:hypothetical protein M514_05134 [Trichuris suis]|uniref:Integrase core domain protein n=1 Tax=Trichuris suis TaxID=68888 RepID=A0A085MSI3_9BILA|nr:hypothetical protein M514_05134 [Trichuris suis]